MSLPQNLIDDLRAAVAAIEAHGSDENETQAAVVATGPREFVEGARVAAPSFAEGFHGARRLASHEASEMTDPVTSRVAIGRFNGGDLFVFARLRIPA